MKRYLLGSSSLLGIGGVLGAGLFAAPAVAADGIKLSVGGFFREAYLVVEDDDDEFELGKDRAADGFFNDAEIHFTGSTVLDNGLEVGARIELEGENDDDQIDEAWVWFAGGFGEVRIGSEDDALANACIVPPGGTTNFSAFSPNQWGANGGFVAAAFSLFTSNSVCTGVDLKGDAQKIVYISPNFAGFQVTASYTPGGGDETHDDGAGPHIGMPDHEVFEGRHNTSLYATYSYEGDDWGLTAGLGGSWQGHAEESGGSHTKEQDFYQAGVNLTLGNFGFGVVGEYYNDMINITIDSSNLKNDVWVVGGGASYALDAWTFGLQYSHRESDIRQGSGSNFDITQDRGVATVNYALGPGITVDGEIAYTWLDSDPELDQGVDDYDAIEFGIGTAITF